MLILMVICIAIVAAYLRYKIEMREIEKFLETVPGPRAWPIIGNMNVFMGSSAKDIWKAIFNLHKQYDSPLRYWLGPRPYLGVHKPEHIEVAMTNSSTNHKGDVYELMAQTIGYGLIQQNNPIKHRVHRRLLSMPIKLIVSEQVAKIDEISQELAKSFSCLVNGETFDVLHKFESAAMTLVTQTLLGQSMTNTDNTNKTLVRIFSEMYASVGERMYKIWLHPKILFRLSKHYNIQKQVSIVDNIINEFIDNKMDKMPLTGNHEEEEYQTDCLKYMLHVKDNEQNLIFSHQDILEEVKTIYTASQDTIAMVSSYTMLMLAMHKEFQDLVWKEQVQVMGSGGDPDIPVTYDHLKNMTFLHMVIQEVLRMFPIGPILLRKTTNQVQIGKYKVPKGLNILVNAYFVHNDPRIWENPEIFNPFRFTPEEKAKRHPYSFIPFGGGIRGCIGKEYAFMGIKCFISHLIRNYSVETDWTMEDIKIKIDISVRSIHGYKIRLKHRKHDQF